ncbi:helix-turn-helix domain-containing protein [Actinomarinicola tropica]|uniref:Helix-turn-helix domain-containing protein n=1 Tax=Actinomarinicola tropica TaxID=2789776 RepID=A0A5Q2RDV1_9ACTN|nr:helix-turn-helix domain-containing protein [Actinomarinicola tropica]QGG95068.1 helix-turn-helix domain-containing protein [Actinomarinicola tropica]
MAATEGRPRHRHESAHAPSGPSHRHRVVAAVSPGVNLFEMAVAAEVFGLERPEVGVEWYDFAIATADARPVPVGGGATLTPSAALDAVAHAGTVIVPNASPVAPATSPAMIDALCDAHARGARIVSFCSGAFALAEAGLLDGRPATTHWVFAEELAARFPAVQLRENVLFVDDGDVLTSAGTAAAIDLALHIVRRDHGADVANTVARRMVVPPHRDGGQAQFVAQPVVDDGCDPADALAPVLEWALAHLRDPITVDQLAARALMSPRTFARRFQASVGTTPLQWVLRQRIHRAQELLETTDLPLDRVAEEAGLGTAANLRLHLRRVAQTSPSAYRRTFRRTPADAPTG